MAGWGAQIRRSAARARRSGSSTPASNLILLAFETSCDETSAAVTRDGDVLSSIVSSQIQLHAEYGGVVPELAAREHLRNLPVVARAALREAGVTAADVDAVAATQGPGLPTALMMGLKAAQGFAFAMNRPFIGVHHHEAHLYSPWISGDPLRADFSRFERHVSLIVSGGHTMLVLVEAEGRHRVLGSTLDDAAGECFDKTGKLMGLPYPAGPVIDRLAAEGNPAAHTFPRPMLHDAGDDFSFSGLKTSVRYHLRDHPEILDDARQLRDLCASVQAAIVDVLVGKLVRVARRERVNCVTVSGGVSCNSELRRRIQETCARHRITPRIAGGGLSTDNAAMVAILAWRKMLRDAAPAGLDADIMPGWELGNGG